MKEPIKGKEYLCIKTVVMDLEYTAYIKGKVYISEQKGCITNEKNNANHFWTKNGMNECFTEIKETFEITKETILKYKMKDEFPEVFDVKLDVGKWYKNDQNAIFFTCNVNDKKPYGYGITAGKGFVKDDNFGAWSVSGIELATEQEVFEALKNEAVRRGFVGKDIYIKIGDMKYCLESEIGKFQLASNLFFYQGANIFKNGKWAKIIPTKTKEEAEKLLGVKIID